MSEEISFRKREESFENLSKIPIIAVKLEEFLKRFETHENFVRERFAKVEEKIEQIESLRERLAQLETFTDNLNGRVRTLEETVLDSIKNTNFFLKRVNVELIITIIGIVSSLIYILVRK